MGPAVGQLGWERRGLERGLPPLGLLVQPRADPRLHLGDDFLEEVRGLQLAAAGWVDDPVGELLLDDPGDDRAHRRGAEDLLGLALELRLGQPDRHDGRQAGEDVLLLDLVAADLEPSRVELELLAEHLDERLVEALHVGAALGRGDDVDEREHLRVVAGAPSQCHVDDAVAGELGHRHMAGRVEDRDVLGERAGALQPPDLGDRRVGGEEVDELGDPAVVDEGLLVHAVCARSPRQTALVADHQRQPGDEERRLPRPGGQLLEVELGARLEDLVVRPEPDPRPGHPPLGTADDRERALALVCGEGRLGALTPAVGEGARLAAPEAHPVGLAGRGRPRRRAGRTGR